jgi:hypothetical protein
VFDVFFCLEQVGKSCGFGGWIVLSLGFGDPWTKDCGGKAGVCELIDFDDFTLPKQSIFCQRSRTRDVLITIEYVGEASLTYVSPLLHHYVRSKTCDKVHVNNSNPRGHSIQNWQSTVIEPGGI